MPVKTLSGPNTIPLGSHDKSLELDLNKTPVVAVDSLAPRPSWKEIALGQDGSTRRFMTWWSAGMVIATTVRVACFMPGIFGNYLMRNLGPLERERVGWSMILAVRAWDLALGGWIWSRIDGLARRDGVLFGALIAMFSRLSLYSFEHSYFLLSTSTIATLLLTDIVSLSSAFALLPTLLPHPPTAHPSATGWRRIVRNPQLLINIALAAGLATTVAATYTYAMERVGGMEWVKERVFDVKVPSYLSQDTLTPSEMMQNPTISVPLIRSFLTPLKMPTHLLASLALTTLSIPLVTILPTLSSSALSLLAFLIIAPSSTLMLWDVLPISFYGALGAGSSMGLRGAIVTGIVTWVLEELREVELVVAEGTVVIVETEEGEKGEEEVVGIEVDEIEVLDEEAVGEYLEESSAGTKHVRL